MACPPRRRGSPGSTVAGLPSLVAAAARPAVLAASLHPGPAALRRVPALADGLQADLALGVDLLDLDGEVIAHVHGFLHAGQTLATAELRDVDQAVAGGRDVDERAERRGLHHGPVE